MKLQKNQFAAVSIPKGALYGAQTVRCLQNLSCSSYKLSSYPLLIKALARVKKAAALANEQAGVIQMVVCQSICAACDEVIELKHCHQFPVDMLHGGGSIAFNQNMNEVLASLATLNSGTTIDRIDPKIHVNASQSTADSCSTAFRLALLEASEQLIAVLHGINGVLAQKSEQYAATVTVARTCLQDAMPVQISSMFSGWSSVLHRREHRLVAALNGLHRINLGGTVIGSGQGASASYRGKVVSVLNQLSGREFSLREDLYDAAQNCDDIGEVSSALCQLAEVLIKICSDLRLLSSGPNFGFGEIALPAVQEGSSFFSNKNNPVVPETVLQACFHVLGNHRAVQATLEHAELNLNVFESGAFFHTLESLLIMQSALDLLLDKCLRNITVNQAKCAEMLRQHQALSDHSGESESQSQGKENIQK